MVEETQPDIESSYSSGPWQRIGSRFECPICGLTRNNKNQIEKHMHIHDEEEEDSGYTCRECSYQTSNKDQLIEHIERAHTQNTKSLFKCDMCKINFKSQRDINVHDVNKHKKSYKPCRNFSMNNRCEFDSECNFQHIKLKQGDHICYKCGDIFSNKTLLIKHISSEHGEEPCRRFAENKCTFGYRCHFKHVMTPAQNVAIGLQNQPSQEAPSVFSQPPTTGKALMVGQEKMYQLMNQFLSLVMSNMSLH